MSSRRSIRNSDRASRTNAEKSPKKKLDDQPVGGGAKLNEGKKEIAKNSGKADVSTSKEQKVSKSEAFSFVRVSHLPSTCGKGI